MEKRAFDAAVVAISDQQLVLGIGFLAGGLSDCTLSFYSLWNLDAVAWLFLVVHLSTLLVLNIGGYVISPSNEN